MAGKEKYTPDEVIDAIRKATGMVYVAADRLGCWPQTIYNYAKRYRKVAQELDRQSGLMGDRTELKLFKAIADGEPWAITFYLRTKHKARGYIVKTETEQSGDLVIRVKYDGDSAAPSQAAPGPEDGQE